MRSVIPPHWLLYCLLKDWNHLRKEDAKTHLMSPWLCRLRQDNKITLSHKSQTMRSVACGYFIPVSVEELSPGSLCDLRRGKKPSLSFRSRKICSRKTGCGGFACTVRSGRSWAGPDGAGQDGLLNTDEEPRREAVQGRTLISGIKECWDPAKNSNWEQLLANIAWRRRTGDLWWKQWSKFITYLPTNTHRWKTGTSPLLNKCVTPLGVCWHLSKLLFTDWTCRIGTCLVMENSHLSTMLVMMKL